MNRSFPASLDWESLDFNLIRHIRSLELGVTTLRKEVKSKLGGNPSGSSGKFPKRESSWWLGADWISECVAGVEAQADIDQREIAGREREALRVHERTSASA
ncbi:hypothetical protein FOVSG1_006139 [Fusarium oxysporum f. sp. vasinfectum]